MSAEAWVDNLPRTIEAFFYMSASDEGYRKRSIDAHAAFLEMYDLTAGEVPLVLYDPSSLADNGPLLVCVLCG